MKNPFASKELPEAQRRRVDLAIAVAQERLLSIHVEHALDLIELVGDQVPFDSALDIYTRLLRLTEDEARVITTRALAILGERTAGSESWTEKIARSEAPPTEESTATGPRRFIDQVRSRFRGRVNEDLRRWIELSAAGTEVAILYAHVENSLNFVELLQKDLPFMEAVELYLEALEVRDSVAEVAYYIALSRLSEQHLPKRPEAKRGGSRRSALEERRLRVLESEGA